MDDKQRQLRELPKIDELVVRVEAGATDLPRWAIVDAARALVAEMRARVLAGAAGTLELAAVVERARKLARPSLHPVINATGVVVHTNLGRAPLGAAIAQHVAQVATGYCNLEIDLASGERGSRHAHVSAVLAELLGSEAAVVVNNNAAAVVLALAALAPDREVVVSRGELVEIGGAFRIPEVMVTSGARLVEVGTTNKTYIGDYRRACGANTAVLLKVHPSNFAMIGFTAEVTGEELCALGRELELLTMFDLGSGCLLPEVRQSELGLPVETTPAQAIAWGFDVVTFSGDKLLGGPQAGIIAGREAAITRIRKHPLMRALRPDKLTLAALEATLAQYRSAAPQLPVMQMLAEPPEAVRERAYALLERCQPLPSGVSLEVVACDSQVGGGAMPLSKMASFALRIATPRCDALATALRLRSVVARIERGAVYCDLRTVGESELAPLATALREALCEV